MNHISWFQHTFPEEYQRLPSLFHLPTIVEQFEVSSTLWNLIQKHYEFSSKFAVFFKQVASFNPGLDAFFSSYVQLRFNKIMEYDDRAKEYGELFPFSMFEVELYLLDDDESEFEVYLMACYENLAYFNDIDDIRFLFIFKKCFERMKSAHPKLFKKFMDYVIKLHQYGDTGNLQFNRKLVDKGMQAVLTNISNGKPKIDRPTEFSFSRSAITQAKFFLKIFLENPEKAKDFGHFIIAMNNIGSSREFILNIAMFLLYLNKLLEVKCEKIFNTPTINDQESAAKALRQLLQVLNTIGCLMPNLQKYLKY